MKTITGTACIFLLCCTAAFADPLQVAVSIMPQKYFLEKIGGSLVSVMVMAEPGADVHTYEPKPRQMRVLAGADLYFAVGADFERVWLKKIAAANTAMPIVHTHDAVVRRAMAAHDHDHHGHDHTGSPDPHVWLSPPLVRVMAEKIRDELIEADPAHAAAYRRNYRAFAEEINQVDSQILRLLAEKTAGARFFVYHPAWGYFAVTYGLEQVPIESEGKKPGPREMAALIRRARDEGVQAVFVQPQISDKSALTIAAEIGARVVKADPLAYEWAENLLSVAEKFAGTAKEKND